MNVPTVKCPKCQHEWPEVSEQGVTLAQYGKCFGCLTSGVIEALAPRQEAAPYVIEICSTCAGFPKPTCVVCGKRGWVSVPK